MNGDLPDDRVAQPSRVTFQIGLGIVGVGGGIAMLTGALEPSESGWTALVPDAFRPAIAVTLVAIGIALVIPGILWVILQLVGPRSPVVHFEVDHIAIRGSLFPRTFVVPRDAVRAVHLWAFGSFCPPAFGLAPIVVVKTADGRGRGIQYVYRGDASELLQDLAKWASVPIDATREGTDGTPQA